MEWVWISSISNIPRTTLEAAMDDCLQPGPALVLTWYTAQDAPVNLFVQCLPSQVPTPALPPALQKLILSVEKVRKTSFLPVSVC